MDHIRSPGVPSFRGMAFLLIPALRFGPGGGVMLIVVSPGPVSVTARHAGAQLLLPTSPD
jgi:hypothetical protein